MVRQFNRLCDEVLQEWLSGPKIFHAIYDSSKAKDPIKEFHKKCDKCGPTVVVFHCKNNSMLGGYTTQDWEPPGKTGSFKMDRKAFLFQIFNQGLFQPEIYQMGDCRFAIYCRDDIGPTFGGDDERREVVTRMTPSTQWATEGNVWVDYHPGNTQIYRNQKQAFKNVARIEIFQVIDDDSYIDKSWRNVSNVPVESLKDELIKWKPYTDSMDHYKLLLVGQIGAGKSSFINSVQSAFSGYVSSSVCTGSDITSLTMKISEHKIINRADNTALKIRIWDTPGLEPLTLKCQEAEIIHIIQGKPPTFMKKVLTTISGFLFQRREEITTQDKIHCVAYVIDGTVLEMLPREVKETYNKIRRFCIQQGVPQVVLLTKVDQVCKMVDRHPSLTFHSKAIKDLVDMTHEQLGVTRNQIFPIKNYEQECELEDAIDRLTLLSLRQMLRFADDKSSNDV